MRVEGSGWKRSILPSLGEFIEIINVFDVPETLFNITKDFLKIFEIFQVVLPRKFSSRFLCNCAKI